MKLAAIFSDGMVLQRDKEIYVFGESDTSEIINIEIDNIKVRDAVLPGKWFIKLPAHAAGGPYEMVISAVTEPNKVKGAKTVKIIRDILYGEVWFDNGQSNIEFELQNSDGGTEAIQKADYPEIRYFKAIKAPVIDDDFLKEEEKLHWHMCQNGDFSEMSAIGYFFAQKLHENLKIPVGIVDCYWGGTSISCWLQDRILKSVPEGMLYVDEYKTAIEGKTEEEYLVEVNAYNEAVENYLKVSSELTKENPDITPGELRKMAGDYPWPPPAGQKSAFRPGGLIETMVKRVAPYTVRGIIYYQGEEDAVRNYEDIKAKSRCDDMSYESIYRVLLRKLVAEYRALFCEENLPIVLVQLPMFLAGNEEDVRKWAYIREAQERVCSEYDSMIMVPLIDLGEYDNVHPVNKKTPGERISEEVLKKIYLDENAGATHMEISRVYRTSEGVVLELDNTYGDIVLEDNELLDIRKESTSSEKGEIFGLEIEAMDTVDENGNKVFTWRVPKRVEIDRNRIVICEESEVISVRYAFFDYGKVNIYNNRHIPLAPFRKAVTDIINISPFFKEEIWGGSKMRSEFGYDIPSDKTGECWAISAHPNGPGRVSDGQYKGMLLSELWKKHRELFGNLNGDRFPLLTKIIDASDKLSVQVHPDDEYAALNENGSLGKMECWYILEAEPDANIIIGHNASTKEELENLIHEGKWNELLREIPVKRGDFIQINPGTIHAINGGIMILETQQNSDITYRLYDYDRKKNGVPRELHIEKSLDVIRVPYVDENVHACEQDGWLTELYECKYYKIWKGMLRKEETLKIDQPFLIGSVIEGTAHINGRRYYKGAHFIIPSGMGELIFSGNADFIFSASCC